MKNSFATLGLILAVLLGSAGVIYSNNIEPDIENTLNDCPEGTIEDMASGECVTPEIHSGNIVACRDLFPKTYLESIQAKELQKITTIDRLDILLDGRANDFSSHLTFANRTGIDIDELVTFFDYKRLDLLTGEPLWPGHIGIVFSYEGSSMGVCFPNDYMSPQVILIEDRYFDNPFGGWEKHITFSTMSAHFSFGTNSKTTSVETVSFALHDPTEKYFWGREIYGGMGDSQWFWDRLALEEARSISGGNSFAWRGELYDCDNSDACKIVGPNP